MCVGASQSLGMSDCAADASSCVWHLGEHGMGADFAGQKLLPSSNSQQREQSPQLPTQGVGLGAHQPTPAGYLHQREQHTALLRTPTGRLNQQQVYQKDLKGFKRQPSAQIGTGLAA